MAQRLYHPDCCSDDKPPWKTALLAAALVVSLLSRPNQLDTQCHINIKMQQPVALHKSDLAFCIFAIYVQRQLVFTHRLLFIVYHSMFRPNWPSSGVQVAVIKESAAHCNAVLLFLLNCLGLFLVMWVNQLLYLGVLEQLICKCLPHGFVGL
jgi:hypothetical protein